jgi:hypothetical protein
MQMVALHRKLQHAKICPRPRRICQSLPHGRKDELRAQGFEPRPQHHMHRMSWRMRPPRRMPNIAPLPNPFSPGARSPPTPSAPLRRKRQAELVDARGRGRARTDQLRPRSRRHSPSIAHIRAGSRHEIGSSGELMPNQDGSPIQIRSAVRQRRHPRGKKPGMQPSAPARQAPQRAMPRTERRRAAHTAAQNRARRTLKAAPRTRARRTLKAAPHTEGRAAHTAAPRTEGRAAHTAAPRTEGRAGRAAHSPHTEGRAAHRGAEVSPRPPHRRRRA